GNAVLQEGHAARTRVRIDPWLVAGSEIGLPLGLAAGSVEALDALAGTHAMEKNDLLASNCSPGVTATQGIAPQHFWAAGRPRIGKLLAVGMSIAMRAENLRPIAGDGLAGP